MIVMLLKLTKFAVTDRGADITIDCGFADPVKSLLQDVNVYPVEGVAVSCTEVPLV